MLVASRRSPGAGGGQARREGPSPSSSVFPAAAAAAHNIGGVKESVQPTENLFVNWDQFGGGGGGVSNLVFYI